MRALACAALLAFLTALPAAAEPARIRLGLLAFGTVQWEIETIRAEGLDAAHDVALEVTALASKDGAAVALLGGAVDAIVSDWLWVSRQRAMGDDLTFVPWSAMTGALLVPAGSKITSLADLAGKRIGIAGGPLDKSWLLLRALATQRHGLDLDKSTEPSFGAPPLLAQQLEAGRLDALLTFWQYAVPLELKGMRRLIEVSTIPAELGIKANPPLLGWVFRRPWADAHPEALRGFLAAGFQAKARLCGDDSPWRRIEPLTKAGDDATRHALRHGFCAGIPAAWGERERDAAAQVHAVMTRLGGPDLVGPAPALQDGTFWPGYRH